MDNCVEQDLSNDVVSVVLRSQKKEMIAILREEEENQHYSIYFQ